MNRIRHWAFERQPKCELALPRLPANPPISVTDIAIHRGMWEIKIIFYQYKLSTHPSSIKLNQNLNPSFMKLDSVDPLDDPANDCITMIIKVCCIMFIFDHAS